MQRTKCVTVFVCFIWNRTEGMMNPQFDIHIIIVVVRVRENERDNGNATRLNCHLLKKKINVFFSISMVHK